jgi:micrococcal nuclease
MFKYNAIVDRVVDGDTVDLSIDLGFDIWHRIRVRINGLDTPEKNFDYGKVVRQYVADTLESKQVEIASHKKDKYGRYLVDLYLDTIPGKTFNQHLLDEGMAHDYSGGKRHGIWSEEELARRTHPLLLTKIDFED